ncbi:MAG: hypothetical protein ACRD1R_02925 [Acidobacteriota bacterium]
MGVEIVLVGGAKLAVSWEMDGLNEGLSINLDSGDSNSEDRQGELVDVSTTDGWKRVLGRKIEGLAFASHIPNDGCPEALWSIRLDLSGTASVVIALGEMRGDHLGYLPDGLVVIFNEVEARSYRILSSSQSSWC